ncbi:MAG: hypothetical protein O2894_06015 [Planctomycetota bacterium]|nr:hypothetical protein [Planctomycetota bacterium]
MKKPLTALETAAFNTILDTQHESEGWLDLTRVSSRTARHLADVRQACARLARYGLVSIDERAEDERWLRFSIPDPAQD